VVLSATQPGVPRVRAPPSDMLITSAPFCEHHPIASTTCATDTPAFGPKTLAFMSSAPGATDATPMPFVLIVLPTCEPWLSRSSSGAQLSPGRGNAASMTTFPCRSWCVLLTPPSITHTRRPAPVVAARSARICFMFHCQPRRQKVAVVW
jgi:hypothetical protein